VVVRYFLTTWHSACHSRPPRVRTFAQHTAWSIFYAGEEGVMVTTAKWRGARFSWASAATKRRDTRYREVHVIQGLAGSRPTLLTYMRSGAAG